LPNPPVDEAGKLNQDERKSHFIFWPNAKFNPLTGGSCLCSSHFYAGTQATTAKTKPTSLRKGEKLGKKKPLRAWDERN